MGFLVCLCRKMGGKCIHKHGVCTHVCVSRDAHALSRAPGGVARSAHLCPRAAGAGGPNVSAKLVSQQGMTWYKMHVFLLSLGWGGELPLLQNRWQILNSLASLPAPGQVASCLSGTAARTPGRPAGLQPFSWRPQGIPLSRRGASPRLCPSVWMYVSVSTEHEKPACRPHLCPLKTPGARTSRRCLPQALGPAPLAPATFPDSAPSRVAALLPAVSAWGPRGRQLP